VTSRRRARSLPEVPTMEESGLRDFEVVEWNPVLAPAGLAPELAARLRGAIRQAMDDVEVLGRVRSLSGEVFADSSAQAAAAFIAAQRTQWARVIRERRITVE
jgi:tripartite-type tricarboxylate transporter receptor subunit TctC